eukprot:scaffold114415_cov33-Tisochrysis_lutea.AAC.1
MGISWLNLSLPHIHHIRRKMTLAAMGQCASANEAGEPAREGLGHLCIMALACHSLWKEGGWFLAHSGGGVERGGGPCPPMGQPSV